MSVEITELETSEAPYPLSRRQMLLSGLAFLTAPSAAAGVPKRSLEHVLNITTEPVDPKTAGIYVWNPAYAAKWTKNLIIQGYRLVSDHPSLVEKYRVLHERLLTEGNIAEREFSGVVGMTSADFGRVHSEEYLDKVLKHARKPLIVEALRMTETPITRGIVQLQGAFVNGTYTAAQIALEQGIAMNLGGGLHHAMPDSEEGFCIFNDTAIALRRLLSEGRIENAMIIDCDVHHGNGNAYDFMQEERVTIADVYQRNLYPTVKYPIDLALFFDTERTRVTDELYLARLERIAEQVEERRPDIVFYLAGADPFVGDRLGGFLLTKEGLKERDRYIISELRKRKIPVAVTLAGGYAANPSDLIDIHYNTAMVVKAHHT